MIERESALELNFNYDWVCTLLQEFITEDCSFGQFIQETLEDKSKSKRYRGKIKRKLKNFIPYFEFSLTHAQRALIRQDLIDLNFKTARKSVLGVEVDSIILENKHMIYPSNRTTVTPSIQINPILIQVNLPFQNAKLSEELVIALDGLMKLRVQKFLEIMPLKWLKCLILPCKEKS